MIEIKEKFWKRRHVEEKAKRVYFRGEKTSEWYRELEKKILKGEEEIKNIQFKFIEILAIFVAIIGFLFGFVNFASRWQFSFLQTAFLIILFGVFILIFISLTHKLFSNF